MHKKHKNARKRTKTKKAVLNALKKHLRGRKLFIRLFAFLCFLCALCTLCAFFCVKQTRQHFHAHEKHLSESRLFAFCAFGAFCACEIFSFKK